MLSKQKYHSLFLLMAVLFAGFLSIWLGKDLCWDIANYHYYNPYAYFNHRDTLDYWPSSYIHQYLNPTIDFLTYFLINLQKPMLAEFILGAIHGINIWLLYLIAKHFVKENSWLALLLVFCGIYGPTVWPGMGSFQNDSLVSIFVLGFVYLQIPEVEKTFPSTLKILMSAAMLGIGIGLKLTIAIYACGALIATLFTIQGTKEKIKWLSLLISGLGIGLLLSSGHWMYLMWHKYHNPLFPFLNNIFHSPYFPASNWRDIRFLPKDNWQTLFYPFYFSWDGRIADMPFQDFRFAITYLFFIWTAVYLLVKKFYLKIDTTIPIAIKWLSIFFVSSYLIWQAYFSIARYLSPLEMLSPLLIFLLASISIPSLKLRYALLGIIFYTIIFFMTPMQMVRAPWYDSSFFNIELPSSASVVKNAVVLMPYPAYVMDIDPRPQSYLIPFFPKTWRFIGIPFQQEKYLDQDKGADRKIATLLHLENRPIYFISPEPNVTEMYKTANHFGLIAAGKCEGIYSDRQKISHVDVVLCPLKISKDRVFSF